jgi:hypothetical protein
MVAVIYRDALEDDIPFVLSSWLRSFCRSRPPDIDMHDYYAGHHDLLVRLLGQCKTTIACPSNTPSVIIGFCSYDEQVVHYLYVKGAFRAKRVSEAVVALKLIDSCVDLTTPIIVSHKTDAWRKFADKHSINYHYNPYPAYLAGFVDSLRKARKDHQWMLKSNQSHSETRVTA